MANAYILVVFGILCAKAGGFLRDAVFASSFGTGVQTDIYFQIFGIASLVFTAVGSALSTLIIKNINKAEHSQGDGQDRYAAYFMRNICLLIGAITVLLYVFAKPLVSILLPSLEGEDFLLAVKIMYIMLPSFLFISIAYMMSGLLQNRRVFFTPSVMSLPYNVIVIAVLLFGVNDIETISIITTLGWFLHIVILLPDFYKKGYRFFLKPAEAVKKSGWSNTLETLLIFISGLMFQLCFLFDKMCVSYEEGMVTTLSYGSNLFITFSGIFVVAMSSVVFPAISQNYEHGEMEYVRELIRYMIKLMVSIFAFYLIAVLFFGDFAVSVIYERGAFTHNDTINVAMAFTIYSLGIFGYLAQNILNKLFYIAGKYRVTVIGAVVVVLTNAVIDYIFVPRFGVYFAAASTTVLLTAYALFVAIRLKGIIGSYITKPLCITMAKIAASACVSALCIFIGVALMPETLQFIHYILLFAAAAVIYILTLVLTGVLKDLFTTPLSRVKKG